MQQSKDQVQKQIYTRMTKKNTKEKNEGVAIVKSKSRLELIEML